MKHLKKGLLLGLSIVPCVAFAQLTVDIDVKSNVHEISPYIYGSNVLLENGTAYRWGGNRTSAYNWENNASNAGKDYKNNSDNFFDYSNSPTPAVPITEAVRAADGKKQYSLITLQAAGYVAADKNGAVKQEEFAPSTRWKEVKFRKNTVESPYSLEPDKTDDYVYMDELINYLNETLGHAGDGGVSGYAIDNEPFLWHSTHPLMHKKEISFNELFEKTIELSTVIREMAPGTEIFGPMFYGWHDANNNSSIEYYNANKKHDMKYKWFVDYYLDTLARKEAETGIKPIDVIAFHWYPESYGKTTKKRIVLEECSASELIAPDMIEARLQAPRTFWDPTYTFYGKNGGESMVSIQLRQGGKALIPKIKSSVDEFYPGTKIAFTEFKFDAENHWSGGLSLADVLGVFGKEDVYMACKWDPFGTFSTAAYNLYLNYDGEGGQFGSTSVNAVQNDVEKLSSFASLDAEKRLHIVTVNKSSQAESVTFNTANGFYAGGQVYGFGESSAKITLLGTIDEIKGQSFTYTLPAHSATHIILDPVPQTKLVFAEVQNANPNKIVLSFEDEISAKSATEPVTEFSVIVDENPATISKVEVSGKVATITLETAITNANKEILVSYNGTNVMGKSNLPIEFLDSEFVQNNIENAPLFVRSAEINPLGIQISLLLSRNVESIDKIDEILLKQNDDVVAVKTIVKSETDENILIITPAKRIVKYKTTTISTTKNSGIVATDGTALSDFEISVVGGSNYAPRIESLNLKNNFTIELVFATKINKVEDFNQAGFSFAVNDKPLVVDARDGLFGNNILFTTTEPIFGGDKVTLSYEDKGMIVSIHDGVLDPIESMELTNNLPVTNWTTTNLPGTIYATEYYTSTGSVALEEQSDDSDLSKDYTLGYISNRDKIVYKVSAAEEGDYSITFRYAGTNKGLVNMVVGDEVFPFLVQATGGFTTWKEAYRMIHLPAGDYDFVLDFVTGGFNINYMTISAEEKIMVEELTAKSIQKDGKRGSLTFTTDILNVNAEEIQAFYTDTQESITITKVDIFNNRVYIYFENPICKGDLVSVHYTSAAVETINESIVEEATVELKNNSTYVPSTSSAISEVGNAGLSVLPIPAKTNESITIITGFAGTNTYSVINALGEVIKSGEFVGETSISLIQQGVYSVMVTNGTNSATQKIVVQ